jgi:hypothetical protein
MKNILLFILNIVVFILLRYITILIIFLNGIGPHAKYSFWDYIPVFLLQSTFLIYFLIKKKKQKQKVLFYSITLVALTLLFLGSHLRLIPSKIIPY